MGGGYFGKSIIDKNEVIYYREWYRENQFKINESLLKKKLKQNNFKSGFTFITKLIDN